MRWCTVEEDEFIADIVGSTGFATVSFPVNPGQVSTFPWLSKQAAQWEKYRWDYLEFYYKPEVSAFATNGQAGKVILSMDYDASDAPPSNKQQAEDTDPHTDAMPYEDLLLILDPYQMFEMADSKYVRPGGLPGSTDIKTYDSGNLSVSTIGNTNNSLLGELHVRYAVTFEVPVLETSAGGSVPANNQVAVFQTSTFQTLITATPTTLALTNALANGVGAVNTAGSIVLPAGNYLVDAFVDGEDSANELMSLHLDIKKNGTAIFTGTNTPLAENGAIGGAQFLQVMQTGFVTMNGTDALTVVCNFIGAAGTLTVSGLLRIVAI